jgi:glucokinase
MQSTPIRVLSGDIGGTKTRLAVVIVDGTRLRTEREQSYASRDYAGFDELLDDFLRNSDIPDRVAFGIAGPVQGRVALTTNLPWRIDADELQSRYGFRVCELLNDLEGTASGLPALSAEDILNLHEGIPHASGNMAMIAAGTGLGEAGLYWDGQLYHPFATEGGHASFSPGDDMEVALLRHLKQRHAHVSWERIVSGPGLVSLHEFLCLHRNVPTPDWLRHELRQGDAAAAIANAALSGRDELCVEALDWFVRLYGAEAGNLALKVMSRGGIYLGGGIAPKILPYLKNGTFLNAFFDKGRMRPLLESMPVRVILNDRAALYGPALHVAKK